MPRQHRLFELINSCKICLSTENNLTVINAKVGFPYTKGSSANLILIQPFANFYEELQILGMKVFCEMNQETDVSIVHVPKSKFEGFGAIARAIKLTKRYVIVDGDKKDGIDSYLNKIKSLTSILGISIKDHGKAFCFDPSKINEDLLEDWQKKAEIKKNSDGFFTAEGMFSPRLIDNGSRELALSFENRLKGRVADLGAGWGWLSFEALKQDIEKIDLFEVYYPSFQASKLNVSNTRADCFWLDVERIYNPKSYDAVIMNPPFHSGRLKDHGLGNIFINKAAEILNGNGTLFMVANRHLPYEKTLSRLFNNVKISVRKSGFKIIEAKKRKY